MIGTATLILAVVTVSSAAAAPCVQPPGMAIGPIVPTADAAREVYKTFAAIRNDLIRPTNDIRVDDEGDHWIVFQYPKHIDDSATDSRGNEIVHVVNGGGTLALEINKCDAHTVGYYQR